MRKAIPVPVPAPDPAPGHYALLRHEDTHGLPALQLHVSLHRPQVERLHLQYTLSGDCSGVIWPGRAETPAPEVGLWQHSCFELFIGMAGSSAYHEFNFSPSGDWAVFAFSGQRQKTGDCSAVLAPHIHSQAEPGQLRVTVETPLPQSIVTQGSRGADVIVGLSAVIEMKDGQRCHWALAHPCDDPDFHARAGWLARLPPILQPQQKTTP